MQKERTKLMNKQEFYNNVVEGIKTKLGDGFLVAVNEVIKINLTLDGLTIMEKCTNIAPTIYLNKYKDQFDAGRSLDSILSELISIYETHCNCDDIPVADYYDFDVLKDKIIVKIINTDKNERFLQETPHILLENLDLAATFYVMLSSTPEYNLGIHIKENHLKLWNMDVSQLLPIAVTNTNHMYHFVIRSMSSILLGFCDDTDLSEEDFADIPDCMYVLTDAQGKCMGSSALLLTDKIKEFADRCGCDLYILPSSIHELILIREDFPNIDIANLKAMVKEVNETEVSESDFLSDNVYYYSRKQNLISKL